MLSQASSSRWQSLLDARLYDRDPVLSPGELDALERVERHSVGEWPPDLYEALDRLLRPIRDMLELSGVSSDVRIDIRRFLAIQMRRIGTAFWGWTLDNWREALGRCFLHHRPQVLLVGYQSRLRRSAGRRWTRP